MKGRHFERSYYPHENNWTWDSVHVVHKKVEKDQTHPKRRSFSHWLKYNPEHTPSNKTYASHSPSKSLKFMVLHTVRISNQDQKRMLNAMATQHAATQGLFLSPILAHFQNVPLNPVLFRSSSDGAIDRRYAQVHIKSRTTVSKL